MIYLDCRLPSSLRLENVWHRLRFTTENKDTLRFLSKFDSLKDLDSYVQSITDGKYLFITQIELGI